MSITEPEGIAILLLAAGVLLAASALLSRVAGRTGVPVVLVFLVLGMIAGSEGLGGIPFEDYALAFRVGTVGLALILFDGGLNTSWVSFRMAIGPGASLATTTSISARRRTSRTLIRSIPARWPISDGEKASTSMVG